MNIYTYTVYLLSKTKKVHQNKNFQRKTDRQTYLVVMWLYSDLLPTTSKPSGNA